MSRLEEECIMYVGRNRSGIDSGRIDYGILMERFDNMSASDLKDAVQTLTVLMSRVTERLSELADKDEAKP